jgi:hypothetical protein
MIVVASHDRVDLLENMLDKLSKINLNGHRVLIVDTNSQNLEYKSKYKTFQTQYPEFLFDNKNYTSWDSGAYIHAYLNYDDKSFIFLQDSLDITNLNLIPTIDNFLEIYDVVPIFNFAYGYENEIQKEFTERGLEINSLPKWAIFGPIFGVTKETMDKLPKSWLIEPYDKITGCGMERRWSLMFHLIGAAKHYLEWEDIPKGHTILSSKQNINKHFFYRL